MAKFIEKVKEFATGKNKEERDYEREYEKEIRKESMKAELEERKIQNVRLAREKIRAKADARIKSFRQPKPAYGGFTMNYGSPFGQPRQLPVRRVAVPVRRKVKKSKVRYITVRQPAPARFDMLGGSFGGSRKGFRVI